MSYGKKLRIEFVSYSGETYYFDIYKRDYVGAVEERDGVPPAVVIDYGDGANEDMPVIIGSRATVTFYSEAQNEFSEFYAADKREFYGQLVCGTVIMWKGWIVPEQRNERLQYKAPVSLTFMDGLGELKNIDFTDESGNDYTGRFSYITLLSTILSKLELGINFCTMINFWESTISTVNESFENIYVDFETYAGMTCAEVLESAMRGCRIMQSYEIGVNSFFLVQSLTSLQKYATVVPSSGPGITVKVSMYTQAGGGVANHTWAIHKSVDDDNIFHSEAPGFNNWSAWGSLDVKNVYSKITDLLQNGSFENGTVGWDTHIPMPNPRMGIIGVGNGKKALIIRGADEEPTYDNKYISQTFTGVKQSASGMRLKFRYNLFEGESGIYPGEAYINYGLYLTKDSDSSVMYAGMVDDPNTESIILDFNAAGEAWAIYGISVTPYNKINHERASIDVVEKEKLSELIDYEILIKDIPANGSITICFWPHDVYEARDDYNLIIDDVALEFIDADLLDYPIESNDKLVNTRQFIENGEEVELFQGYVPEDDNRVNIYRSQLTTNSTPSYFAELFKTDLSANTYTYNELIARIIISSHRLPALTVDYQLDVDKGFIPPHSVIYDPNSSAVSFFMIASMTFDVENSRLTGTMVEILPLDETSTLSHVEGERATGSDKSRSGGSPQHPPVTIAETSSPELTIDQANQIISIDLSAYAKLEDLHDAVTLAEGCASELTLTGQVLSLDLSNYVNISGGANGDILYYNNGWQRLAKGTDGHVLTLTSGLPSWAAGGGGGFPSGATAGDMLYYNGTAWALLESTNAAQKFLKMGSNNDPQWESIRQSLWATSPTGIYFATGSVGINNTGEVGCSLSVSPYNAAGYGIRAYGTGSGVAISASAENGSGVSASSNYGNGVYGQSAYSSGVYGSSTNGYGVYGYSSASVGVRGDSASGYGGSFGGLGVNISAGGLAIGGTTRISSSGVFTPSNGDSVTYTDANGNTLTFTNGILTGHSFI